MLLPAARIDAEGEVLPMVRALAAADVVLYFATSAARAAPVGAAPRAGILIDTVIGAVGPLTLLTAGIADALGKGAGTDAGGVFELPPPPPQEARARASARVPIGANELRIAISLIVRSP
jgi:hypothetical protein